MHTPKGNARSSTAPSGSARFWFICVAATATPWALAAVAKAQVAVTSSNDVAITQVSYQDDGFSDPNSSTGRIIINEAQLAADTGISGGYVDVSDSSGNVLAENVPMIPGEPFLATNFNLETPDGTNETGDSMKLSVDVTAAPQTSFVPTTPTSFTVAGQEEDSNEGEGALLGTPAAPGIVNLPFALNGQNRLVVQLGHQNVQAADNQCGPAALANGLNWLSRFQGLPIPDANNPGRGNIAGGTVLVPAGAGAENVGVIGQNPNGGNPGVAGSSLVGALDLTINRASASRVNGATTTGDQQTVGLEKYLGGPNVNDAALVSINTQGVGVFTNNGITNTSFGAKVTPNFLFSELSANSTVKLGYTNHAVDMIATGSVFGVPFEVEQSDLVQTSQGDPLDQKLNSFFPFGLASSANIPTFSFIDTRPATPLLVGIGANVTLFNAIGIDVVPEPGTLALAAGGVAWLLARRRRA